MNPQWKAKWIEALRSGRYKRTCGTVRRGDCFCPLGVLRDLVDPTRWSNAGDEWRYADQLCYVPNNVSALVWLNWATERSIATANDRGQTFDQIADWLEKLCQ